jgi:hypothetical protein
MRQDPPYLDDAEADRVWHHATDALLGVRSLIPTGLGDVSPFVSPAGGVTTDEIRTFSALVATVIPPSLDLSTAYNTTLGVSGFSPHELVYGAPSDGGDEDLHTPSGLFPRPIRHLNTKAIRRILAAKETIFKYGVFLPRNDRDADNSPERVRWHSGRQLEWLRLKEVGAFEYDWTSDRLTREYPDYLRQDIGHLFYIYDYKFSGEHRVRLVFDGSRQGINTYDETYSPTVRPESIRLFHVYSVEMGWDIKQYDVPQAFLQSPVDHDIFAYPPRSNVEFPGQLLKLRLALYGAKQSSALFYKLLHSFLLSLGFTSSTMDPCFYKRNGGPGFDALLIVHVDDMRCSGTPSALAYVHNALLHRFKITTGDGTRFLGMDTSYDLSAGVLTMGMATYIQSTMDRFQGFDLTLGLPYREIVGCLLWIVLCVNGPDLVRVKDLAKRSNSATAADYDDALKVLRRIFKRRSAVIYFKRGYAGRELVPSNTRPVFMDSSVSTFAANVSSSLDLPTSFLESCDSQDDFVLQFEETQKDMDISTLPLPTTQRFTTSAYTDAAFAVGVLKISISGFTIFVNCTPVMWGSIPQTSNVDSTCSAEFVAASICCKQLVHVENMFRFLGFLCPKPYPVYTDSQASLSIASNRQRMGKIRHIQIRYHLVRGMVLSGDVLLYFCVTEDMIADLFTKILVGASYDRLSIRFYFCAA